MSWLVDVSVSESIGEPRTEFEKVYFFFSGLTVLMILDDRMLNLRRMYEGFRRGEVDPLAVRDEAASFLEEVKEKANREFLEEIEDMLVDLAFSIEEDRCNCQHKCSSS